MKQPLLALPLALLLAAPATRGAAWLSAASDEAPAAVLPVPTP